MDEDIFFPAWWEDYQKKAASFMLPTENVSSGLCFAVLALNGEAGEVAEKVKKAMRDAAGCISQQKREEILLELSDVLWALNQCVVELNCDLHTLAKMNIAKLEGRKERGVLQGEGDSR